jgi:3-hydroxyacyl-[acyl-carrier-protein] dehydratase
MREHAAIGAVLPQRHPLLLVDRVQDIDPGRSIRAIKAITGTEPCYAGLPEGAECWRYHYPYSLMIESFGQTAALLWLDGRPPAVNDDQVLMFVAATDVHFEGTAQPGDVLRHEVRLDTVIADTAFASGETWVGDRRVVTVATLVATRRPVRRGVASPPGGLPRGASSNSTDSWQQCGEGSR